MIRAAVLPLCAALALVAGAGCHRGARPDGTAAKAVAPAAESLRARDFYPLKVGHRWTYDVVAGAKSASRTIEIVREDRGWFLDTGDGALRHDAQGLRDPQRYLLREPLVEGQKWNVVVSAQSTERYEVVEAGRPCAVPAGTFARCIRVRATNRLDRKRVLVNESTYAEGVGLVEQVILREEEGRPAEEQIRVRLVSYSLAG